MSAATTIHFTHEKAEINLFIICWYETNYK